MTKTTTPRAFVIAIALATTALAGLLIPEASAHPCQAKDPEKSCGECREGFHYHEHNDHTIYCKSEPTAESLPGDVSVLVPYDLIDRLLS